MLVSVITPFSRGVKELETLLRDFNNQTLKDFEHILVHDGSPIRPEILKKFEEIDKKHPNTQLVAIEKDPGDMSTAPGTRPRNHGTQLAKGDYVVYCDDDDRYKDVFLETLIMSMPAENGVSVVQMSCSEARMFRDGDPTRIRCIPEVGLPAFPLICHVGTPCFMVPRQWALDDPWQEEPEHDYRFIKRICEKHKPTIRLEAKMLVDVDSLVIGDLKDWVSHPPFYRGD